MEHPLIGRLPSVSAADHTDRGLLTTENRVLRSAFRRTALPSRGSTEPPGRACGSVFCSSHRPKDDALRPRPFFMPEWRL
ncbi:hypothetical protein SGCZBJ_03545 [Caulobacter zeae]|uniref:Uncharacterized protein n=1 Tax=Caulobacter zeae TaxID=2055137 RepID=A0A2N5DQ18_9CAUL|nr:hypothetical protein SGCZBJ_03545 [Caulobacter zeae]